MRKGKHGSRYRKANSGQHQTPTSKSPSPEQEHPEGQRVAAPRSGERKQELSLALPSQATRPVEWINVTVLGLTLAVLSVYTWHVATQTELLRTQTKSVKTTQQLDQRAWVGIEAVAIVGKPVVGEPVTVVITFRNTGKTPALNVHQYYAWGYLPIGAAPAMTESTAAKGSKEHVVSHAPVFPTVANYATIKTDNLTGEQSQLLAAHVLALHVYGRISYRDIFRQEHWTKYCFHNHFATLEWHVCDAGNGTDDEADAQQSGAHQAVTPN